jgi:hypothetical protein
MAFGFYQLFRPRFPVGVNKAFPYINLTNPTQLPFTLAQVKLFLRVADPTSTTEDLLLTTMIQAASDYCQKYTKITFYTTTFLTYRDFFSWSFELRKYPFQNSFQPIIEYLVDTTWTLVDRSIYFTTNETLKYSQIELVPGTTWPVNYTLNFFRDQSVRITFIAGLGEDSTTIPGGLQMGMLNHISAMYENRGDCSTCDTGSCGMFLPVESKIEYDMWKIRSIGPSRQ